MFKQYKIKAISVEDLKLKYGGGRTGAKKKHIVIEPKDREVGCPQWGDLLVSADNGAGAALGAGATFTSDFHHHSTIPINQTNMAIWSLIFRLKELKYQGSSTSCNIQRRSGLYQM